MAGSYGLKLNCQESSEVLKTSKFASICKVSSDWPLFIVLLDYDLSRLTLGFSFGLVVVGLGNQTFLIIAHMIVTWSHSSRIQIPRTPAPISKPVSLLRPLIVFMFFALSRFISSSFLMKCLSESDNFANSLVISTLGISLLFAMPVISPAGSLSKLGAAKSQTKRSYIKTLHYINSCKYSRYDTSHQFMTTF